MRQANERMTMAIVKDGKEMSFKSYMDECDRLYAAEKARRPETLEDLVADIAALERDPLVRLAADEEGLRQCLTNIRDGLRKRQARGKALEEAGITAELVRRYMHDYGQTDECL